jgi:hypothetical protein
VDDTVTPLGLMDIHQQAIIRNPAIQEYIVLAKAPVVQPASQFFILNQREPQRSTETTFRSN